MNISVHMTVWALVVWMVLTAILGAIAGFIGATAGYREQERNRR